MNNIKKYVLPGLIAVTVVCVYTKNSHRAIPADLRDAVADNGSFDTSIPAIGKSGANVPVSRSAAVGGLSKGYVAGLDPSYIGKPITWIAIPGGKFMMGTSSGEENFKDAKPVHQVTIKDFYMSKTVVTVEQYAECVDKGGCTDPQVKDENCNWGKPGRQLFPINCVTWDQAQAYAKFNGARLPSESEWEYAATSGGRNQKYPWGNDEPTCEKAVIPLNGVAGCGTKGMLPVCSKPAGNTAQGLCDMIGNVWEWVQDKYADSYKDAPIDGQAFEATGTSRVMRGGSCTAQVTDALRSDYRASGNGAFNIVGFRVAKSR